MGELECNRLYVIVNQKYYYNKLTKFNKKYAGSVGTYNSIALYPDQVKFMENLWFLWGFSDLETYLQ